jgi:Na+/H+ antiporter NhaB
VARFDLKDLLQAIGPTASLIFAAWIFLSYLQQRYSGAYDRYRNLVEEFRAHGDHDERRRSVLEQILEYKRRCQQMRLATHLGLLAAVILISSIISAALCVMTDDFAAFKYLSAALAIVGLLIVIWAALLVIIENWRLQLIIDSDLSDRPELVRAAQDSNRVGAQSADAVQPSANSRGS